MGIITWIVVGLAAGSVATLAMPGPDRLGIFRTMLLGMAGAVVGGLLGFIVGANDVLSFDIRSFMMAVIGALIVMICYRTYSMRAME